MTKQTLTQHSRQLLSQLSLDGLKDAYREARRHEMAGDPDANEARRLVTVEMLRRMSRAQVAAFEREVRRSEAVSA